MTSVNHYFQVLIMCLLTVYYHRLHQGKAIDWLELTHTCESTVQSGAVNMQTNQKQMINRSMINWRWKPLLLCFLIYQDARANHAFPYTFWILLSTLAAAAIWDPSLEPQWRACWKSDHRVKVCLFKQYRKLNWNIKFKHPLLSL